VGPRGGGHMIEFYWSYSFVVLAPTLQITGIIIVVAGKYRIDYVSTDLIFLHSVGYNLKISHGLHVYSLLTTKPQHLMF
jgi:hypothetical protein